MFASYSTLVEMGLISIVMSLVLYHVVHEFTVAQEWVHVLQIGRYDPPIRQLLCLGPRLKLLVRVDNHIDQGWAFRSESAIDLFELRLAVDSNRRNAVGTSNFHHVRKRCAGGGALACKSSE